MEPILTSLIQFGETLSDIYADLRWKHFVEVLEADLAEEHLAREIIHVVSPVNKIVVSRDDRRAGFRIGYENNYWSGYKRLKAEELETEHSQRGFSVAGPRGAKIYIEPVIDVPHINPEFTRIRVENYLNQAFGAVAVTSNDEVLPQKDAQQLLTDFKPYTEDKAASLAKLRQYYVISKVEQNWEASSVKVTNSELKRFLETELGREVKTGYQVTSFAGDFEKIFSGKVTATKTRNALSLSWNKGV